MTSLGRFRKNNDNRNENVTKNEFASFQTS